MVYSFNRLRRQTQIKDDLKNYDDLKNEDDLKNDDDLKNEDDLKNVWHCCATLKTPISVSGIPKPKPKASVSTNQKPMKKDSKYKHTNQHKFPTQEDQIFYLNFPLYELTAN